MTSPPLSPHDRASIGEILAGEGNHFDAQLLRLIAKADQQNRLLLMQVFPEHVYAYLSWASEPLAKARR
jgi:hypothetical protein